MKPLKTLQAGSKNEDVQRPLPGFTVEVESERPGWRKFHETTLDGRLRIKYVKNA